MTSKEYEIFVLNFFKKLNEDDYLKHTKFEHNKRFKGKSTRTWDVDVSYNILVNQLKFKVFIECKYWDQNVDANKISLLKQCLEDCDAHKGVIVTTVGFQSGAIKAAKKLGIGLLILKDNQTEQEWVSHFDGGNVEFKEANTEKYNYSKNENIKFISGQIKPSIGFLNYFNEHLGSELYQMFVNKDFSPLQLLETSVLDEIVDKILKVVDDYEQIEACGLPLTIAGGSYGENLIEIYMIKASRFSN